MSQIDDRYLSDMLKQLLETPSPTGYTDEITRLCCRELERLNIGYEITRRGAIRALIRGGERQPGRAIIGHIDTLGAQVKGLKSNGRLEVRMIGHWSARFAEGARVKIFTIHNDAYRGTILPLKASGHTFGDEIDTQEVSWENLEIRVDVRAEDEKDLKAIGFDIGDMVAVEPQPEFFDNGFIVSRHLDDKGGVAAMFAAMKSIRESDVALPVDAYFLLSITEEIGQGASGILTKDVASLVAIDNGTVAPGQNSSEYGVTIAMGDQVGPFDYHLTQKLIRVCEENDIEFQRDLFRYYRSDSASAIESGEDVRTALVTFGIDSSHGYERTHIHSLHSVARLIRAYVCSEIEIPRDKDDLGDLSGFTEQPMNPHEDEKWEGQDDAPERPGDKS
ncbi:peptidase M42 [Marinicauda pacifica]|uniref:Osmoprotectant NAGGN system M42 family peptidase n=1 Tax=Marinicauda pacifica TaxID=1133559 RepID=A0A4S2HFM3_9PROT|nr:osmoprotectant NAGGN system M42 family peptidase [Marinicauda pacifica]TGY94631.1 osmoprotectant NAGGN system M42 family peptidase [Marinicauda pacifica]GGE37479.1 peptidase M42 [Marinicauda pacifica]